MMELAMPWRESRVMDERMAFIVDWQREDYGMSRRTGYKLRDRFLAEGMAGSATVEAAVLAVRRAHPSWGPKKIRAWLRARDEEMPWPVESTIARLLDRHGLVAKRRRRRCDPLSLSDLARR
jgi:putative transposase